MAIKNKKFGFTLAEALMALLIISLITIASIPVITKKKRIAETSTHGRWMCTLNDQGQHKVYGSEANPSGWVVSGDKCQFLVPRGARGFVVSAIGGGGGGGGSSSETTVFDQSFSVDRYGRYKFFAIGGGGRGGRYDCDKSRDIDRLGLGGGGGAGGFGYGEVDIDDSINSVTITVGQCGGGGGTDGETGGDSVITLNSNYKSEEIIRAKGGGGGAGRRPYCRKGNDGAAGSQGEVVFGSSAVNKKNYNSSDGNGDTRCGSMYCRPYAKKECNGNGCYGMVSRDKVKEMENLFDVSLTPFNGSPNKYGDGGETWSKHLGGILVGTDGYAAMMVDTIYIGEGGKAAPNPKISKFYPSFDKRRFDVTIGAGGKGGEKGMAGNQGGETKVGNLFSVQGGAGGVSYNPTTTDTTGTYAGGNGGDGTLYIKGEVQTTAKGGYASGNTSSADGQDAAYYGSGGGGAGANGSTSGTGGDGAPGFVIIEW